MITTPDEELLAELRQLFNEVDPVDPTLIEQARLAFSWRTVDADLAELTYDSLADPEVLAAVRSVAGLDTGPRLLGFGIEPDGTDDALSVEIEVAAERSGPVLVGQLMPPMPATVTVQRSTGSDQTDIVVPADDLGRFRITAVPTGPVRLLIEAAGRTIATSWVCYRAE